jgi:hypothetical protein
MGGRGGGTVTFSSTRRENREVIQEVLASVGVKSGITANGVNVYSVTLARDLARFKRSGFGRGEWSMPDEPLFWGEWAAGLLDADGTVAKGGKVIYYQKPHGGLDYLEQAMKWFGVLYSRRPRRDRDMEYLSISMRSLDKFRELVQPRFPFKVKRLAK